MKILFLDDMSTRHKAFHALYRNDFDEMTYVYDYDEFVFEMKNSVFDLLFLDHDLSVNTINMNPDDYDERSGTDVVNWIVENICHPREARPGVIVHSMNPAGRERMVSILRDGGFDAVECPFITLLGNKVTFS